MRPDFSRRTTPSVVVRLLLWAILLLGGAGVSVWLDLQWFRPLFFSLWFHLLAFLVGWVLMRLAFRAAAAGGRELARRGKSSPDTPRLETDTLVTTGIYARMRHPMLFGLALVPMGLAFLVGSPSFILFIAPLEALLIAIMVLTFEEWECRRKFGAVYDDYAKKTPAVCWKRDCLKALFSH
ncbi:methyltransferase family protein [Hydrogenimonas sp.]